MVLRKPLKAHATAAQASEVTSLGCLMCEESAILKHFGLSFLDGSGGGRENAEGVDLNRNFPSQWVWSPSSVTEGRAPETLAVMEWTSSSPFVLSANLHGGSVVASYPYDDSDPKLNRTSVYSKSPDDLFFRDLATGYASRNPLMGSGNPHCPDKETFPGGVTNGADWYDVSGSMQDWNYVFTNTFEVTFELSCCKFPLASQLPLEWQRNRASMLWFTGQVHRGAKGVVKDNETLKPIHGAKVKIVGNTHHVVTSKRGEYWRLLMPGNYSLVVEADG
ncbi:unnamed protein product [Cyprideis torosa]|uniref:Peptidase M14 domain-containing protein n=1 Tax=Cyprideis torosa TaxID=163714 RepID=A0A7R8ZW82_9CRUS|nr:unnamed protein product [Cyprideis torosa]CAG0904764.1 unnamed protein product [Cyprideis torosa]